MPALFVTACDAGRPPEAEAPVEADTAQGATEDDDIPVNIASPGEGAILSGLETLRVEAENPGGGVHTVSWELDGTPVVQDVERLSTAWNTCGWPPGPHQLTATVTDDLGRRGSDRVNIVLEQAFTLELVVPSDVLVPLDELAVLASDDLPIVNVVWMIDGLEVARAEAGAPDSECDTECPALCQRFVAALGPVSEGGHTLTVVATNEAGETMAVTQDLLRDADADADGYESAAWGGLDCDDDDASRSPAAPERCDGLDHDCDGEADELWDLDGDGFLDDALCSAGDDCDDTDADVHPDALEVCNGVDDNCDGYTDVSAAPEVDGVVAAPTRAATITEQLWGNVYVPQHDLQLRSFDAYLEATGTLHFSVHEADETTGEFVLVARRSVAPVYPLNWAASGTLDVPLVGGRRYFLGVTSPSDLSLRFQSSPSLATSAGLVPKGLAKHTSGRAPISFRAIPDDNSLLHQTLHTYWVADENLDNDGDGLNPWCGDCDDADPDAATGLSERCDGVDNDCDGVVPADEADDDGDGARLCHGDCDDADPARFPTSVEHCDGIDNDCDPLTTEDDADGDGVYACWDGAIMDCDDDDASTLFAIRYADDDGDGWGDAATASTDCPWHPDATLDAGDCDDADGDVSPDAAEVCDGVDNDCNGVDDEGWDADGDGIAGCEDCDDTNPSSHPGADEVCGNEVDEDCDGEADTCRYDARSASDADATVEGSLPTEGVGTGLAAGDFDGDGQTELVVASWGGDYGGEFSSGAVSILDEPPRGRVALSAENATQLYGEDANEYVGKAIAVADLDLDGRDDLVATAPNDDQGGSNAGAAWVIHAPDLATGPIASAGQVILGTSDADHLGQSLAVGDVTGDGTPDLVLGGTRYSESARGGAWIFVGPLVAGLRAGDADAVLVGAEEYDDAGASLASGGDLTGDGLDDILVGAPHAGKGMLYLVAEPSGRLDLGNADTRFTAETGAQYLGVCTPVLADIDGDGWTDVLAMASKDGGVEPESGAVFGWAGPFGSERRTSDAELTIGGQSEGDGLGCDIADAGDLDGDGHADLLIGAPWGDSGGVAYVVYGPVRGTVSAGDAGVPILGEAQWDGFGRTLVAVPGLVELEETTLVIGAAGSDRGVGAGGAVFLFGAPG